MATANHIQYDFVSGLPMDELNRHFIDAYKNAGFQHMDKISKLLIPAIYDALLNCFSSIKETPRYSAMELLWSRGTMEGVDFPLLKLQTSGDTIWNLELDLLLVLRNIELSFDVSEPTMFIESEDRSFGCCIVSSDKIDPVKTWGDCCIQGQRSKHHPGQYYLSAQKILDDLFENVQSTFRQIPLLTEMFTLEYKSPVILLTMKPELEAEVKVPEVFVECKIMAALELPVEFISFVRNRKDKSSSESANNDSVKNNSKRLFLVSYPSSTVKLGMEWRLSFHDVEKSLFAKIKHKTPSAIVCYRLFALLCSYHLFYPNCLDLLHLNTIFLTSYRKMPPSIWTTENIARNVLGLLGELSDSLATGSIFCYFTSCFNLLENSDQDFLRTLTLKLQKIRRNAIEALKQCIV